MKRVGDEQTDCEAIYQADKSTIHLPLFLTRYWRTITMPYSEEILGENMRPTNCLRERIHEAKFHFPSVSYVI